MHTRAPWVSVLLSSVLIVLLGARVPAQSSTATLDTATVQRNLSGRGASSTAAQADGLYRATNVPLAPIVEFAYGIAVYQLLGGPAWLRADRFDITLKAPADATPAQLQQLLRSLLEDRFKLVVHREQRDMPVHALLVAAADGRPGPALTRAVAGCENTAPDAAQRDRVNVDLRNGFVTSEGRCTSVAGIAGLASRTLSAPVVDKTGLTGAWDYSLRFSLDASAPSASSSAGPQSAKGVAALAAALREQLGLTLDSSQSPVDVLLVDSVRPLPEQ